MARLVSSVVCTSLLVAVGSASARVRILINPSDPEVVEDWKWRGVPVWSHAGMICTGENRR
jgi:hypothetical protein